MGRNWTPEQKAAIDAHGGTLLVSAAAGSGKTAVLVERVIKMITDAARPCDVDRLLVVTFTKAAAAEMRERISQRLADMIEQNPFDTNLQRQQMLLQNAHISTIHSFCADLLREHFEKLDIPPDFQIADQNEVEILLDDVLSQLLERKYAAPDNGAFIELSQILSSGRDDKNLVKTIRSLYEFTRSLDDPDGWLDNMAAMYETDKPFKDTVWGKTAVDYVGQAIESAIDSHSRVLEKIYENDKLQKAYAPAFESDLAGFREILNKARQGTWDELRAAVAGFKFERLGTARNCGDEALKEEAKNERKGVRDLFKNLNEGILSCGESDFQSDLQKLRPVVGCLRDIVRELDRRFFSEKLSRGKLDFSDLEQLTLKLLVEKDEKGVRLTKTAAEIAERFDEILVDEYQDTNEVQDMIFRAVSRGGKNLFMVGDVKQSIYSFRQARPEIFMEKAKAFKVYDGANFPAKIILGRNFRSRSGVTDAVNFVFSRLMSEKLGGVDYGGAERLVPGATYFDRGGADFALHIIDTAGYDGEEENIELEARHIAREIKRLISEGFKVQGENGPRNAAYRDFCILLRSRSGRADKYARVLEDEGIPVYADIDNGYLGAYEVMVMVSFLRILDNPLLDIPLVSVLLSPVFGFTPDDVAQIRLKDREKSLYLAMLELSKSGDTRFDGFLQLVEKLRTLAAVLPADQLILRIYDETGLLNVFEAMPNGGMRRANLRLLLEYARAYESAGWRGLSGFIRFIDRVDRQSGDLAPASNISENADVVRIMSIHKSKGLEFPVCFIADLSKKFNKEDIQNTSALFHPECGFGSKIRDDELYCRFTTLPCEAVKIEKEKSLLSEELRVLYVAMTRAKEKLYAVMTFKDCQSELKKAAAIAQSCGEGGKISPYLATTAQNPAELLLAAALFHPSCGCLREKAGFNLHAPAQECSVWEIETIPASELSPNAREKAADEDSAQAVGEVARLKAEIEKKIAYDYPHKILSRLPSKVSVSELTHAEEPEFNAEFVRPSFLEGESLTPAEAGTALHAFMQYCDLEAVKSADAAAAEIERLVSEGFLLPEQGAAVDVEKVAAFASSPIFDRLMKAARLWREFRFNIEVPACKIYPDAKGVETKILLQGMADLVFEEEGGAVLVDYKTDRVKRAEQLVENYHTQLECYSKAVNEILGLPVKERYIYSFHLSRAIKV